MYKKHSLESSETPVPNIQDARCLKVNPGNVHLNNLKAPSSMC